MNTLKSKAKWTREQFQPVTYHNREDNTFRIVDNAPEWIQDMVRTAHSDECVDMLPDNTRFNYVVEALDLLSIDGEKALENNTADVYTHELTAWLDSHVQRVAYVDKVLETTNFNKITAFMLLQFAQNTEKDYIMQSLINFLEDGIEYDSETDCYYRVRP